MLVRAMSQEMWRGKPEVRSNGFTCGSKLFTKYLTKCLFNRNICLKHVSGNLNGLLLCGTNTMNVFDGIEEPDMDDLIVPNFVQFGIPRQMFQRQNYFETMDDATFRRRFRLSKPIVLSLLAEIEHRLEIPMDINNCVSPMNQLLTCLRLYSSGGHLDSIADFMGINHCGNDAQVFRNRKGYF
ncbi:hypothetical protein QE152_g29232 [Popillia japonica]|uniref:Uncharacterized protein n=1 Tax=Popillia japonica TaxID=7064 RepID=A0AAW1JIP6_POPJA